MDVSKKPEDPPEDENFIVTATAVATPCPPKARPYLEVVAPATLPEGYTFEAQANGEYFTVTVPMGGVEEGQKFQVQAPDGSRVFPASRSAVPVGHWKDDLCACCSLGCCHPSLCMAYCCPMLLLGQVMTRLKLTWSAQEDGNRTQASSTFRILVFLWIAWIITQIIMQSLKLALINESGELDAEVEFFVFLLNVLVLTFSLFFLIITCRTRRHIREKYQIPEQQCHGCEDCCCTYWCTCCTISQMARHTGDYANHGARWCSETGMPAGATISEIGLTPTVVNSIV